MRNLYISNINLLQFDNLSESNCFHFVTTRNGGVSQGNYKSLNFGLYSGDNPQNLVENINRLADSINISSQQIYIPKQIHGNKALIIDNEFLQTDKNHQTQLLNGVDALITNIPNVCITIATADCVPIIIYDKQKKVLATIHAGWRGTVGKIVEKTIQKMINTFGSYPLDMLAGIGPSISAQKFEVGVEVLHEFEKIGYDINTISFQHLITRNPHINLWEANRMQLLKMGVKLENIETAELCTYKNEDLFFSARRQGIESGRILTGGYIKE